MINDKLKRLNKLADKKYHISVKQVRQMISDITNVTRELLISAGFPERQVRALCTKLRDAGRRSPPWNAFSRRVPGRPQDGADGNRRLRWLFKSSHKFYANEVTATLVEVRYYLQVLSMKNAPSLPENTIQEKFIWLTDHKIIPEAYLDPIQLIQIDLKDILSNLRSLHSGHLIPLDREGKHEPKNAYLVLSRSNQLQGNLTSKELLELMKQILERHDALEKK